MSRFDVVADEYEDVLDRLPPARRAADDVREIHWMLEELRVSFFAQELRTPYPVSEKRILRALAQLTAV
jgi:ATP-dependent helicase HrpA